MRIAAPLLALLLLTGGLIAQAQEPTAGPYAYHQLRTYSAVSGAGFGVDEEGYFSLSGPVAYSTPVANTLGHNHFHIGGTQYSFSTDPVFAAAAGNWDYFVGYGFTEGHFNIFVSDNVVNTEFQELYNIQFQYVPRKGTRLTFAAGIEDIFDTSKTVNNTGQFGVSSFTYFGVATYRVSSGRYPLYLTAGSGNRRFAPGFGSLSIQVAHPVRLWTEEDRYGNVAGFLFTTKLGNGPHGAPLEVQMGRGKGRYFVFGMGIDF